MLKVLMSLCCNFTFLWVQFSTYDVGKRLRHKNHLVRVHKILCFGLKILLWSPQDTAYNFSTKRYIFHCLKHG